MSSSSSTSSSSAMEDSAGHVSIDVERISLGGKEHIIKSSHGSVSVVVYGDQSKPALITYPDVALNHISCFQVLFFCPEVSSLLLHNFCIYHISPPGHELGAAPIASNLPIPSVDDLADQVLDVLSFFGLGAVMCMGVTAGAYVLTLFSMKYAERVLGLILVSPLCKTPSWTEWFFNKLMNNLLYFYGTCGLVKELLLQRYFSKEARLSESNLVAACRSLLDERQSTNVRRFLQSIHGRRDISQGLKKLQCRTLIFVGENSSFHSDALHMISELNPTRSALIEVRACGSLVTEEQVSAMLVPLERFLMGFGLFGPARLGCESVSPARVWPELLSPDSMKLKPIRTRVSAGTR